MNVLKIRTHLGNLCATALLLAIWIPFAQAGTIDAAEFCVTETEFRFLIEVTSLDVDTGDVFLGAYTELDWLSGPQEYFYLNMDRACQVTRGNFPEVLDQSGSPPLDRLQNGLISTYSLTSLGEGQCQFAGTIPHGADAYVPGDTVKDVFFREFGGSPDTHVLDTAITECLDSPSFTVGGTVSGLSGVVTLQNNGGDDLDVSADGDFTFASALADGSSYAVTVLTQPTGQTCTVTEGTGTISSANVDTVVVTCVADPVATYTVGGAVSGLSGTVTLQNNGGDDLDVSADGDFIFATALADGSSYAITVLTQPTGQTCIVTGDSGVVSGADVIDVAVDCEADAQPPVSVEAVPVPVNSALALALLSMTIMLLGGVMLSIRR